MFCATISVDSFIRSEKPVSPNFSSSYRVGGGSPQVNFSATYSTIQQLKQRVRWWIKYMIIMVYWIKDKNVAWCVIIFTRSLLLKRLTSSTRFIFYKYFIDRAIHQISTKNNSFRVIQRGVSFLYSVNHLVCTNKLFSTQKGISLMRMS